MKPASTPTLAAISTLPAIVACALLGATQVGAATCTMSPSTCDPYVVTIDQVGNNVVAMSNQGGEFDLTGLVLRSPLSLPLIVQTQANVSAFQGSIALSTNPVIDGANVRPDVYTTPSQGLFGPTSFGTGGRTVAENSNGPDVGNSTNALSGATRVLAVPAGYASGDPLDISQNIWDDATLAADSLGITPGIYTWRWGNAADQTFTICAGDVACTAPPTIPVPAALPLFATGLGGLGLLGWRRKRKARVSLLGAA